MQPSTKLRKYGKTEIMGLSKKWLKALRNKFYKTLSLHSCKEITIHHHTSDDHNSREPITLGEEKATTTGDIDAPPPSPLTPHYFSELDMAAIKIQATFRGHLARRAFKALRSLVKLQALARGAYVRKQAAIAFQFMDALVRLQVRVRTRQPLNKREDGDVA